MCASLVATADELTVGHTSAASVFKDERVVKLLKAAINRDVLEAKHLIASGVNVNTVAEGGITPLVWLQANNDTDGMEILLDLGADPNKYVPGEAGKIGPPVWLAAGAGRMKTLQVLLDHGGNPNLAIGGKSPLMMAIRESHLDCAELLLQRGADINYSAGDSYGSALGSAMLHVQFGDAIWVLNHGYTHDLPTGRRMLAIDNPRPGQEAMKEEALKIIDRLLAEQKKSEKK